MRANAKRRRGAPFLCKQHEKPTPEQQKGYDGPSIKRKLMRLRTSDAPDGEAGTSGSGPGINAGLLTPIAGKQTRPRCPHPRAGAVPFDNGCASAFSKD